MLGRQCLQLAHIGGQTSDVNGHDGLGIWPDELPRPRWVEAVRLRVDVGKDRYPASLKHGRRRRDERVGGDDHLAAGR